jgi:hypothetical protein
MIFEIARTLPNTSPPTSSYSDHISVFLKTQVYVYPPQHRLYSFFRIMKRPLYQFNGQFLTHRILIRIVTSLGLVYSCTALNLKISLKSPNSSVCEGVIRFTVCWGVIFVYCVGV